jgi:hypothetical protein
MNRPDRYPLHALVSAVVDATASEQQIGELTHLLRSDPEARRFYVRYLDMHAALTGGQQPLVTVRSRQSPWGLVTASLIVSSLIAASLLVAWLVVPPISRESGEGRTGAPAIAGVQATPASYVATIASATADAILDGKGVVAGVRLTPGEFRLAAGGVNIRFDGGARILLEGTSRFAIHSRRTMRIDEGTFVFHGDQTCESIEITTPHSVFKNIGTQYAAVIDAQREDIHVAEGAVRRTTGDALESQQHERIEAGVGRRYDVEGAGAESIPLDGALLKRSVEESGPGESTAPLAAWDDLLGDAGPINDLKSGTGWIGAWESRRGVLQVSSPGLSGEGSAAVVHDGAASGESKSAAHRKVQAPIDLSTDGIWYVRFLVRRGPAPARDEHVALIVLRTRGLTTQEEVDRSALIQIALRKHDGVFLRVVDTLTRASLPQVADQTYAVVAKIVAGKSQPDQVLVSLMAADRLAGSAEPTEWSLVSEDVDSDLRFEKLSLEFTSGGQIAVGDLCIGPTWASVAQPLDR